MTTPSDVFRNMPDQFNEEKAKDVQMTILFELSGEGGGQWSVNVNQSQLNVSEGPVADPTATIRMDAADYVAMTTGELNPMTAFMSGKVRVEGNLGAVMKFQQIFDM